MMRLCPRRNGLSTAARESENEKNDTRGIEEYGSRDNDGRASTVRETVLR